MSVPTARMRCSPRAVLSRLTEMRHGCTGVVDGTSILSGPNRVAEPRDPLSRKISTFARRVAPVTQPWISAPPHGSAGPLDATCHLAADAVLLQPGDLADHEYVRSDRQRVVFHFIALRVGDLFVLPWIFSFEHRHAVVEHIERERARRKKGLWIDLVDHRDQTSAGFIERRLAVEHDRI